MSLITQREVSRMIVEIINGTVYVGTREEITEALAAQRD